MLTWWEGQLFVGDGDGVGQVYDTSYKPVARCARGNGYTFDLHEFTITPRNTALVLAYERYNRSLKAWGGPADAQIVDNIVQEVDLETGLVPFERHSFGDVSPDESDVAVPKRKAPSGSTSTPTRSISTATAIPRLRPQTSRGLQDRPRHGQDHLAPGRKKSDFKLGRACASTGSTASAPAGRHIQAL